MRSSVLSYGVATNHTTTLAIQNFGNPCIQLFSFCCTPIEILSLDGKDSVLAHATGFFHKYRNDYYLITAWHVLSGRNPFNLDFISKDRIVPRRISFYVPRVKNSSSGFEHQSTRVVVEFDDELIAAPSIQSLPYDVIALKLREPFPSLNADHGTILPSLPDMPMQSACMNENSLRASRSAASDDCSVLGYPLANYDGMRLPFWKSGKIASDTSVGVANLPAFLIDCATTPAMSGSPVLRVEQLVHVTEQGDIFTAKVFDFVGIYAGRLQNAELSQTNLGYVYYSSLIDQAIDQFAIGAV